MPVNFINVKIIFILFSSFLLVSCANTRITQNWTETPLPQTYQHPMILAVTDSQQTRRIFEQHLVSGLAENNITATPSYTLLSAKQKINRQAVFNAIKGTNIDAVLVIYLVIHDTEMKNQHSPINKYYSGNVENSMISDTLVFSRGRYTNDEKIAVKNDLYDAQLKTVVWSVQTKTVAPHSIDEVITDVTELLINQLLDDEILHL